MLALVLVACVVALQGACTDVRDPMNSGPRRAQVLDVIMKSYSFAIYVRIEWEVLKLVLQSTPTACESHVLCCVLHNIIVRLYITTTDYQW